MPSFGITPFKTVYHRALLLLFTGLSALLLSACSSTPDDATASLADNQAATQVAESTASIFPLNEYLYGFWGTGLSYEEQRQRETARQQRETELITQCMHDAGFEYDPDNLPGISVSASDGLAFSNLELWNPTDRNWVSQWGYGIVDSPLGGQQTPRRSQGATSGPAPASNLSMAEQEAFSRALFGPPCEEWGIVEIQSTPWGDGMTCMAPPEWNDRQNWEVMGCTGAAWIQIADESPDGLRHSDEFQPLFIAIGQLQSEIWFEVIDADADWAACMADANFPNLETPDAAQTDIWDRLDEIPINWDASSHVRDADEIAELRESEIELALTDYDCRVVTDYEARRNARRIELENQFINDHREALTALRAAVAQRS